jgi:hypothetical protein
VHIRRYMILAEGIAAVLASIRCGFAADRASVHCSYHISEREGHTFKAGRGY